MGEGGGLFDGEGPLVGLTTVYLEGGQSQNFAAPAGMVGEVRPTYKPVVKGCSRTEGEKRAIALEDMEDWQGMLDWYRN